MKNKLYLILGGLIMGILIDIKLFVIIKLILLFGKLRVGFDLLKKFI